MDENIQDIVRQFNNKPRDRMVPCGHTENEWHISIRNIPFANPSGDVVFITNTHHTSCILHPIPTTLRSLPLPERAAKTAVMTLSAFLEEIWIERTYGSTPWRWITDDKEFADALSVEFDKLGVVDGLKFVGVSTDEEKDVARERWSQYVKSFMRAMNEFETEMDELDAACLLVGLEMLHRQQQQQQQGSNGAGASGEASASNENATSNEEPSTSNETAAPSDDTATPNETTGQ